MLDDSVWLLCQDRQASRANTLYTVLFRFNSYRMSSVFTMQMSDHHAHINPVAWPLTTISQAAACVCERLLQGE